MALEVTAGVDKNAILREIQKIKALLAMAELVSNSFDAASAIVNIYTDHLDNPTKAIIVDQGIGMTDEAIRAFYQYGKSFWTTKRHRGTNGKGSKYALNHSIKMIVRTKTKDRPKVVVFSLELDSWLDRVIGNKTIRLHDSSAVGEHSHDPSSDSFTLIELSLKKTAQREFAERNLIEQLGEKLSPQYTDRVFVNGHSLQSRKVVGSIIEDHMDDPMLGEVNAYIYKPEKVTLTDVLRIGSVGPVMDFRTFSNELPVGLRKKIPAVFRDHSICGLIEVQGFNQWREGASKEFQEGLFRSDEVKHFMKYLTILGRKISREFGFETATLDEKARRGFQVLSDLTQNAYGEIGEERRTRKKKGTVIGFHVSPKTAVVVPGEPMLFTARGTKEDRFEWDASRVPGELDKTEGQEVHLTIPRGADFDPNCQYQLVVKKMPKNVPRIAYIRIAESLDLTVIPKSGITKYENDVINFRAINIPEGTPTLHWAVEPLGIGEFTRTEGVENVPFVLRAEGKCTVTAFDPNRPDEVFDKVDVYVKGEETEVVRSPNDILKVILEESVFKIETIGGAETLIGVLDDVGQKFLINGEHPRFKDLLKTSEPAWREFMLQWMVNTYVLWKLQQEVHQRIEQGDQEAAITIPEVNKRIGQIMSDLLSN